MTSNALFVAAGRVRFGRDSAFAPQSQLFARSDRAADARRGGAAVDLLPEFVRPLGAIVGAAPRVIV